MASPILQGLLGNLILQGFGGPYTPPTVVAACVITQGYGSGASIITQGFGASTATPTPTLTPVVASPILQGLGSTYLITQGYGGAVATGPMASPLIGIAGLGTSSFAGVADVNASVQAPPLISYAGLGFPDAGDLDPARDYDILQAIQSLIEATNAFDRVVIRGLSEESSDAADDTKLALIEPAIETFEDFADGDEGPELLVRGTCLITICARNEDRRERDRLADLLCNQAKRAINGQCLANLTYPGFTRVKGRRTLPAASEERRYQLVVEYQYVTASFTDFAIDD